MVSLGKTVVRRTKRAMAERALERALGFVGKNPGVSTKYLRKAFSHITGDREDIIKSTIDEWLSEGNPGKEFLQRILKNTHPNVRRHFLASLILNMFYGRDEAYEQCREEYGITPPAVMLISPSMRCNYRCQGCYAGSYERKDDMDPEVFDKIITDAEKLGTAFFTILGGEPFIYPELLDVIGKHRGSCFQVYSNGSFIDKAMARRLVELGNIAPQISVNGPAEYTDASRVPGAFEHVMQAMDNLREAGCVFGFSTLVTTQNLDAICTEEWVDMLIEKGALYGWHFLYMPVGDDPDMSLMPTPQQRNKLRKVMTHFRKTKPILPADFWNDGALTGGCIAGKIYCHINHKGDVEPCIFCHFSTHNIHTSSLAESIASPFFSAIRESQPFSYNTLRPCPMIDHPQTMWGIIQEHGAKPTHEGADKMFTKFEPEMRRYAAGVEELMDDVWDNEGYSDWAAKRIAMCRIPESRVEARRQAYEESRSKKRGAGSPK